MTKNANVIPIFKLLPIAALVCSSLYSGYSYSASVKSSNLKENNWLSDKDEISIIMKSDSNAIESEYKFVLNKNDISTLFKQVHLGVFVYKPTVIPLPSGESSLKVYQVQASGGWEEIAVLPVRVKTLFGFKESEVTTSVTVNIKSELNNGFNGDAVAPPEEEQKQTTMTTSISHNSSSSNDNLNFKTNFNLLGVSKPEEALRFSEKGFDAEKLDLSDYLIELNKDTHKFSLGHVNYGGNRFLISGFGSRGIVYKGKPNDESPLDYSIAKMNGTNIVGYSNITGLEDQSNHRVISATIGYEFIPTREGAFRAELSYLDASILAEADFDTGEIPDAEKNTGYGLKLSASNESGTLRTEATYAISQYTNPADPLLFQDDDIVPVEEQTDSARHVEVSYELYRSDPDDSGNSNAITILGSHERVDPLYKSLAAFAGADNKTNSATLSVQLGAMTIELNNIENEDNIEDLDSVLKTKTDTNGITLGIPFKTILSDQGKENNLIPNLDVQYSRVHQYGANRPVTFDPDSHIPDQYDETKNYTLSWGTDKFAFAYSYSIAEQDNRQIGRDLSDFKNINKGVSIGYQFTSRFDVNIGASNVEAIDYENKLSTYDDNYSLGFNWGISDSLRLTTSYTEAATSDSNISATSDGYSGNAQLSWQFEMPSFSGKKQPGQLFISYLTQNNRSKDNVFNSESNAHSWTINAGLNISLF